MNNLAAATKEMGEGVRDGVIENWSSYHNLQKNVGMRSGLEGRHKLATVQRDQRLAELRDIEQALDSSVLEGWRQMYDDYEREGAGQLWW
ncbi:hypothetical protein GGG16DRAFT_119731 [Schizophyllum commune]